MSENLPRRGFQIDDLEAYRDWEEAQQAKAEAALAPEQRAITWGDHFVRIWREGGWVNSGPVLVIFGAVLTLEELSATEEPETVERLRRLHSRFVFARCYSVVEPEGEYGDVNRWEIWPITLDQFNHASWAGWDPGNDDIQPWIIDAWTDTVQKRSYFEDEPLPPGVTPL